MNNNTIAFTALCNEYCTLMSDCRSISALDLVNKALRLLPRLYICARDLHEANVLDEDGWIDSALTEEQYEITRNDISSVLGEHDVYLEVFEEDMKYSDTPVSASISENLADIYQVLFDYLDAVRLGTDDVVYAAVNAVKESFKEYWGSTLCNVLRALNNLWSQDLIEDDSEHTSVAPESLD